MFLARRGVSGGRPGAGRALRTCRRTASRSAGSGSVPGRTAQPSPAARASQSAVSSQPGEDGDDAAASNAASIGDLSAPAQTAGAPQADAP